MPKIIFFVLQGNIIARLKKLTFMDIKDLKNALYEGIVIFEFVKKNGEHRKARVMWPQKFRRIIKSIWFVIESEFGIVPGSFSILVWYDRYYSIECTVSARF